MVNNWLAFALVFGIIGGWACVILILVSLWVLKGNFKSSYNYRPWKPFVVPEDLADKANREGAKWLLAIVVLLLVSLVLGIAYGWATGDYSLTPFIVLSALLALALVVVGVYLYSWLLLNQRNAGKI
jgi:heme/copper-type cytochrome/quinol oxidase subunit 4